MNETFLKEIFHERDRETPVYKWDYVEISDNDVRVFYKPEKELGSGFIFYAMSYSGHECVPEMEGIKWHPEYTIVQCLYQGIGYFDGVRHLYMGDAKTDNFGYHYYAYLEVNISALQCLRELEKKYCRDFSTK